MATVIGKFNGFIAKRATTESFKADKFAENLFRENKPPPPPKKEVPKFDKNTGLNSNYYRDKRFKEATDSLRPDLKYVKRYQDFLAESYDKALRLQLNRRFRYASGTHTRVGFNTGSLSKSIKTKAKVTLRRDRVKGRINISYNLKSNYNAYGETLNYDRNPKTVSTDVIRAWMNDKIKQGSFRLKAKESSKDTSKSINDRLNGIAFSIQRGWEKNKKPPVLKDWSNYSKNERLRITFEKLIKNKGRYHRNQIRKSIIKNIK